MGMCACMKKRSNQKFISKIVQGVKHQWKRTDCDLCEFREAKISE